MVIYKNPLLAGSSSCDYLNKSADLLRCIDPHHVGVYPDLFFDSEEEAELAIVRYLLQLG